jgi:hypothetical protein
MPRGKTTSKVCDICSREVSLFAYNRHVKAHSNTKTLYKKSNTVLFLPSNCEFCNKYYTDSSGYKNHVRRCKNNPNRDIHAVTPEGRAKIIETGKLQKWTDEKREKHSVSMRKAVLANPESYTSNNVCGRVVIEDYNGEKFHGKWELAVAKWLDKNNIKWERKIKPFSYFWNDKWHLYFPDFYLPTLDKYVEVKGYERERDRCKWAVVPNLIVLKRKEIAEIQQGIFVL